MLTYPGCQNAIELSGHVLLVLLQLLNFILQFILGG